MTSIDPSHVPLLSSSSHPHSGEATVDSVAPSLPTSSFSFPRAFNSSPSDPRLTSTAEPTETQAQGQSEHWRGAWTRRQEQRRADARAGGRIPVPALPDLRYEQGILASIRPFVHRVGPEPPLPEPENESAVDEIKAARQAKEAHAALVSTNLSAEAAKDGRGDGDLFGGAQVLRIEWAQVAYVILRDQLLFPLLQGAAWGLGSLWLAGFWQWNRARLAAKGAGPSTSTGRPLPMRRGLSGR